MLERTLIAALISLASLSACDAGLHVVAVDPPPCVKATCASLQVTCGTPSDGCGGTLSCGTCPAPTCDQTDTDFCARAGKDCGELTGTDTCGLQRTAVCGVCVAPQTCGGAGTANVCGLSNPVPQVCNADGWCLENPTPALSVEAGWALSASDVWVGGWLNQAILHFDGARWSAVPFPGLHVTGLWGAAHDDVWAATEYSGIAHWDGQRWSTFSTFGAQAVWGVSANDVWFVGETVLHWDGTALSTVPLEPCHVGFSTGVWASSAHDVWVVGEDVCHFDGQAWASMRPSATAQDSRYPAVWGASVGDVWVSGLSSFAPPELHHWDGARWSSPAFQDVGSIVSIWGSAADDVWAVAQQTDLNGAKGILHWDGREWSTLFGWYRTDLHVVWGSGHSDVWAGGVSSGLIHSDGARWRRLGTGPTSRLSACVTTGTGVLAFGYDVYVRDAGAWRLRDWPMEEGVGGAAYPALFFAAFGDWAVGSGGIALHMTAQERRAYQTPTQEDLMGVWQSGPNDAWAVGRRGAIVHWDGSAWSSVTTPLGTGPSVTLSAVWGSAANDVWAMGAGPGKTLHWDGTSWTVVAGPDDFVASFWGSGANDLWAVGYRLNHWDGQAWTDVTAQLPGESPSVRLVYGTGPGDVWVFDSLSLVAYHFDGTLWSAEQTLNSVMPVSGMCGSPELGVFAVGEYGLVMHRPR
ncbi:MAG: hypothetical protein QM765_33985 [Myxococcales bacterium]